MIKVMNFAEIQNVVRSVWQLENGIDWNDTAFDLRKAALAATIAQIAYIAVDDNERERNLRAKILPSDIWRSIIQQGSAIDTTAIIAVGDFPAFAIVRTASFVSVIVKIRSVVLIGVRGTQFSYDWPINLAADKFSETGEAGDFYHRGFYEEARLLSARIDHIFQSDDRFIDGHRHEKVIAVCGHSLGGAICAALIKIGFGPYKNGSRSFFRNVPCYTFGAPRLAGHKSRYTIDPYAIRRSGDLVPTVPPTYFGYCDYVEQFSPTGVDWRVGKPASIWSRLSSPSRFYDAVVFKEHSIERYKADVLAAMRHT